MRYVVVVEAAYLFEQLAQLGGERLGRRGRLLAAPCVDIRRGLAHGGCRLYDAAVGVAQSRVDETAPLALEIRGVDACRGYPLAHVGGAFGKLPFGLLAAGEHRAHGALQLLFGLPQLYHILAALAEYLGAERKNVIAHVPAAALVEALLDVVHQPAFELLVFEYLLYQGIGAASQYGVGFQFDVVVEVYAQLLDECAHYALEEAVDSQHREARVVVQYACLSLRGALAHAPLVHTELAAQIGEIAARAAVGEGMQFAQYARLHLFGGLVGKRHGQNRAIEFGTLHDVAYIFVCQLVCLSRAGARIEYLGSYHRLQMFLKSQ